MTNFKDYEEKEKSQEKTLSNDHGYCVYMHTNKINDKKYIGVTKQNPTRRWGTDGNGYRRCPIFYSAICHYGWCNFTHTILCDRLTQDEAWEKEKQYILQYKSNYHDYGYNFASGGNCYDMNSDLAFREKQRRATAKKRGWNSENSIPIDQYDIYHNFIKTWSSSAEAGRAFGTNRVAIRNACVNKNLGTVYGYYWCEHGDTPSWNVEVATPVAQIDPRTNRIINIFLSSNDAEKKIGVIGDTILNCCKGKIKNPRKYIWRYIDAHTVAGHIIDKQTFQEVGIAEAANLLILPETLNKPNELKENA